MSEKKAKDTAATADLNQGVYIVGQVIGRRRRKITLKDQTSKYIISLTILAGAFTFQADRWSDGPTPSDVPSIGSDVTLPIRIKTFAGRNGPRTSYEWGPEKEEETF